MSPKRSLQPQCMSERPGIISSSIKTSRAKPYNSKTGEALRVVQPGYREDGVLSHNTASRSFSVSCPKEGGQALWLKRLLANFSAIIFELYRYTRAPGAVLADGMHPHEPRRCVGSDFHDLPNSQEH
ncbi:hypothetical protein H9L39_10069 [Fusarium oxysporum f. sp. albedinis]|nr:hypothetical protein H9L39_10069 [Fusarium oxysporum f. sp. albedinis]